MSYDSLGIFFYQCWNSYRHNASETLTFVGALLSIKIDKLIPLIMNIIGLKTSKECGKTLHHYWLEFFIVNIYLLCLIDVCSPNRRHVYQYQLCSSPGRPGTLFIWSRLHAWASQEKRKEATQGFEFHVPIYTFTKKFKVWWLCSITLHLK